MSSNPTTRNSFDKQGYGDNDDLWGIQNLNTDLDLIDESLDGIVAISTTGGTVTLDATQYATNQARRRILVITGVLAGALTIITPNVEKWYRVVNGTTGAFSSTVKTAAGTGVVVTQGATWDIHCDGIGAGTMSIDQSPVNLLPATTGDLDLNSHGLLNIGADLNMHSHKITNLTAGSAAADAVRFDQLPGTPWYSNGGTKNANFAATLNYEYIVDTTAGSVTATLDAAAAARDRNRFLKVGSGLFTINLNGLKFNGATVNLSGTAEGIEEIEYSGIAARGWTDL